MMSSDRPPFVKLRDNEVCEACGHKGWCMQSIATIWCMRNPDGAHSTTTDKAGYPVYLHHRTGVPADAPYRSQSAEQRPNWSSANPLGCTYLYTMMAGDFATSDIPAPGLAADADRFGTHAGAARAVADAFYLADPAGLVRRIAAEGRTQDAKNAGILYPDEHERAGQIVSWLKHRKIYAWREGNQVRDLRGRAVGPSTHKVLSLAGSRDERGADGVWYQHRNLAACDGHIRIAGGHEKADALNVAGLPAVGSNEGQASDAMIAALTGAGVILATLHIDGEDPKEGRSLSEGQRLGLAIGERLEAAGIAVRVAEPLRSPGEPKLDADSILRDHGPEALRDLDARAVPLSLFRRRLGLAPTDLDPEQTKRLQEALQRARDEVSTLRELQAAGSYFERNRHVKAEKPTIKAAAFLYAQKLSAGQVDAEGWARTTRAELAEIGGESADAVGKKLARVSDWGVGIHRDVRHEEVRRFDDDGQVAVERRKALYIKVDGKPADVLLALGGDFAPPRPVDKRTGQEKDTWGGKRDACPKCSSQRTHRETRIVCDDCGHVSEPIESTPVLPATDVAEALRAEQLPDAPRPDAESIPPTVVVSSPARHIPIASEEPEEDDDPLPLLADCWHKGCTAIVRPGLRRDGKPQYCDTHQPEAMARRAAPAFSAQDAAPVGLVSAAPAPLLPPSEPPEAVPSRPLPAEASITCVEAQPLDWASVPIAETRQAEAACALCGATMFARPGAPLLCPHHSAGWRAWRALVGYAAAAGGG